MRPLIIIAGPTAVGKSGLAIKLAKLIDGEIISADSIQVYKGFDIGSAKISSEEMEGVRHHLIDVLNPDERFGVDVFVKMASAAIEDIYSRNHIPIIVGGTGFYIQALLYGVDFNEEDHDDSYRNKLNLLADTEEGRVTLYNRLREIDPAYAEGVHYNNAKRVIRALEYQHYTGRLFSDYNREQSERRAIYDFRYFALCLPMETLYERINMRVDMMIHRGLSEEMEKLKELGLNEDTFAMQGIGYREMWPYLNGEISLEDAGELIKKNTRHFAKRQMTWLRREKDVIFIDKNEYKDDDDIAGYIKEVVTDAGLI